MKKLLFLLLSAPIILHAQETTGIQWVTGLSWEQVKQKAKKENKYIFLDCFTTWCGPCKMMDASVFVNDSVGDFFEDKFIAVKVQMDKTEKDKDDVKLWYDDAKMISKQYQIEAFPTLLFFSPEGTLTDKQEGAILEVDRFLSNVSTTLRPGKVYRDPFVVDKKLLLDYKQGLGVENDSLRRLVNYAKHIKDSSFSQLFEQYISYVSGLSKKRRYTKRNIQYWSGLDLTSKSKLFSFFYKDGKLIDRAMNEKRFAAKVVDGVIQKEIVVPFLIEQNKIPNLPMSGYMLTGLPPSYDDADWEQLEKRIRQKFSNVYGKRNTMNAQIEWYRRNQNFNLLIHTIIRKAEVFYDTNISLTEALEINDGAWNAFLFVTDKKLLNKAITWMEYVVKQHSKQSFMVDTYACLLYKVGRREEAIHWEEKGVAAKGYAYQAMEYTLGLMKKGEKWDGVIWE